MASIVIKMLNCNKFQSNAEWPQISKEMWSGTNSYKIYWTATNFKEILRGHKIQKKCGVLPKYKRKVEWPQTLKENAEWTQTLKEIVRASNLKSNAECYQNLEKMLNEAKIYKNVELTQTLNKNIAPNFKA